MKFEVYKYMFEQKWNTGYDQYKISNANLILGDEGFGLFKHKDMIEISISIPSWRNVKRFARLILTPEEAKELKKQL